MMHGPTWLLIVQNRDTDKFPDTTFSRRPGLFLSFRLTYSVRILFLYIAVMPPLLESTVLSIVLARPRIRSDAVKMRR